MSRNRLTHDTSINTPQARVFTCVITIRTRQLYWCAAKPFDFNFDQPYSLVCKLMQGNLHIAASNTSSLLVSI